MKWDKIFTGSKPVEFSSKSEACEIGLVAWANCSVSKPPPRFGEVISAIQKKLKSELCEKPATLENLMGISHLFTKEQ